MGIIAKQSIKGTFYTYAGAAIGFINVGLLMPKFFRADEIGLISILISFTLIFSQISGLGFSAVITRIFPWFQDNEKKHNGILSIGIITTGIGFTISLILIFALKDYLIYSKSGTSSLLESNFKYLPILVLFYVYFVLLDNYNKVLKDSVTGTFLRDFFVRVLNLLIILLYVFNITDFDNFVLLYVLVYISPTLIIFTILLVRRNLLIGKIDKKIFSKHKKEMFFIGLFAIISGFSWIAAANIDKYMINYYLDLSSLGVYTVALSFGAMISMPARPLRKISSIIIAESWKKNDKEIIMQIYRKSSINLFLLSIFLFIGIWINIDNVFKIIPNFAGGKYVFLFIGISGIIEMASGTAALIIANSKYFRYSAFIMIFVILLIIITNIIFIPIWKINGAAFASMISILIAVIIRFFFLFYKFRFQPYNYKHLIITGIAVLLIIVNHFLPELNNLYIDFLYRSTIITLIFSILILKLKVSDDVTKYYKNIISHIGNIFKR
ncbi:MAG: oligosaccharide flippase family protein [Chlorobi bacterium]|nr:oligosaccharide flippase family protein [Chlorobiota bacterium]